MIDTKIKYKESDNLCSPDLVLVNCIHREADGTLSRSPQLGLIYIAMAAKKANFTVKIIAGDNVFKDIISITKVEFYYNYASISFY